VLFFQGSRGLRFLDDAHRRDRLILRLCLAPLFSSVGSRRSISNIACRLVMTFLLWSESFVICERGMCAVSAKTLRKKALAKFFQFSVVILRYSHAHSLRLDSRISNQEQRENQHGNCQFSTILHEKFSGSNCPQVTELSFQTVQAAF